MGLGRRRRTRRQRVYFAAAASEHPFVIRLREDAEKKTDLIGFSAASKADVEAIFAQATAAGAKAISAPAPAGGPAGGFACRFFDLDGRAIEVICDAKKRVARPLKPGEAIPTGLSHVVLHSPDTKKAVKFYEDALGFRVSDWIGEFMVFLRCNTAHHRLAFLPGAPALNHVAFDVASIDDLMRGLGRLTEKGVAVKWGPGRHTAGNNTFSYYLTPNGNSVEYTSDLEEVDEATWQVASVSDGPHDHRSMGHRTHHSGERAVRGKQARSGPLESTGLIASACIVGGGVAGMATALALRARESTSS